MTFWLKTPNNIYKNWLNSQIDRIMFTVSKLEIKNVTIQVEHPVHIHSLELNLFLCCCCRYSFLNLQTLFLFAHQIAVPIPPKEYRLRFGFTPSQIIFTITFTFSSETKRWHSQSWKKKQSFTNLWNMIYMVTSSASLMTHFFWISLWF